MYVRPYFIFACRWLVIAALAGFQIVSHAGYAQLVPPAAFTAATSTAPAMFNGAAAAAANEATWLAGTVRTNAALNVAGNLVKMPVTMRLAANAPSFLAARIGAGLAGGPAGLLVAGLTVGACLALPEIQAWISNADETISVDNAGHWIETIKTSDIVFSDVNSQGQYGDAVAACSVHKPYFAPIVNAVLIFENQSYVSYRCDCPVCGGSIGSVSGVKSIGGITKPVDYVTRVMPKLAATPLPADLPAKLPIPLPVDDPVINPSADPVPMPQPMIVPAGDPVPVPNTSPQQYMQPSVQVTPAPVIGDPWRVDVKPTNVPTTNPSGLTSPVTVPVTNTASTSAPAADVPDLCTLYPDILACSKLGDLPETPPKLPNTEKPFEVVSKEFASNAACPAPVSVDIMGITTVQLSYQPICDFLALAKYVIVLIAAFVAAQILSDSFRVS